MRGEKAISAAHFAPEEVIYVEVGLGCIKVTEDISLQRTLSRHHIIIMLSRASLILLLCQWKNTFAGENNSKPHKYHGGNEEISAFKYKCNVVMQLLKNSF